MFSLIMKWLVLILMLSVLGCQHELREGEVAPSETQTALTSDAAVFLDFTWEGEVVGGGTGAYGYIDEQLKWTIGQLNGDKSVGRIDHVELSDVETNGSVVSYRAKMVVAWGKSSVPESYTFHLPRHGTWSGLTDFLSKYKADCMGDTHGEEPTLSDGWYYYRPQNTSCEQDETDTATFVASVSPSNTATTGKYPEYHKVWEDNTLRIVAIFGKNEEDGDSDDVGYKGFNRMVYQVHEMLRPYNLETFPADIQTESGYSPDAPAPEVTDVELRGTLPDGKRVVVNIFSIPAIRSASAEFYRRYEAVSAAADFISYNGHSGLGSNIRTLATKGKWVRDQYVIVLMNGCTTFAYVDSALATAHARVNPDDSIGDKYLDIFTNARPAYFSRNVQGVMAIVNALMSFDNPKTYDQILSGFDISQVALVSGEEDNSYSPEMSFEPVSRFFDEVTLASKQWKHYGPFSVRQGGVIKVYTGGKLFAGEDVLNDADLYVKRGGRPTSNSHDCSSTTPHATEQCVLAGEGQYYVSVHAWTEGAGTDLDLTVTYQSESAAYCGDGVLQEPEICDGNRVACRDVDPAYVEGEATCNGTCSGYDLSSCVSGAGRVVVQEEGNVEKDEWKHFGPFVHDGGDFSAIMTGTGDADLYVRRGAVPTARDYDCRPYKSSSAESCVLDGPGEYYVSISGYKTDNEFVLTVTYRKEGAGVCGDGLKDPGEVCDGDSMACVDLNSDYSGGGANCNSSCSGYDESGCRREVQEETITRSGTLAKDDFEHFGPFANLEGAFGAVMTGTGDMDLYVRQGARPTTTSYDCRPWSSSSSEQCDFDGPGEYFVSVFGYRAGDYEVSITYHR